MKISLKRVLALVLCAAMLFGMLPMQQVKAEDLGEFSTMDDLRELANGTYEDKAYASFNGTEFVFESIELPHNVVLSMPNAHVTIPAGVTVNLDTIQCVTLTVDGTLNARQVEPRDSITVNGPVCISDYFLLDLNTQISGMENITLEKPYLYYRDGSVSTAEELKAALALAEAATDGATYKIWLSGDGITLDEDLTIPSNFHLTVNAPLTVSTLNLDGGLYINEAGSVNVQGDLLLGVNCGINGGERLTVENGMAQRVFTASNSLELFRAGNRASRPVWEGATDIIEITDTFTTVHDVTIPAGCILRVPVEMTVGEETTLTVNGTMEVIASVTNRGTIRNDGNVTVYGNASGVLSFAEGGSYTGSGVMEVVNSTYEDILPGLDLTDFSMEFIEGFGGIWTLTYNGPSELVPGPDGMYHFTTFAELQQLAAMDLSTWTNAVYDGDDAFVFDTISLPENLALEFIGSSVVIPEGVTVDAPYLFASWLTVNGNLNSSAVSADEALTVNGTLAVSNGLSLRNYTELTGGDNIVLLNDQVRFVRNCNIASLEELEACIADAAACTDHRIVYELFVENEMELTKDYNIPANANFRLRAPVTIAQGATLTLNGGNNDIFATLTVNGTVVNNGFIDYEYDGGGRMDFTQGGTYAGTGNLWIPAGTLTNETFLDAFPGWTPTGYSVSNEGNGWMMQYIKYFNLSFSNFEEMQELAKETYDEWVEITYTGEDPLVISEDITFTGNVVIGAHGKQVRIAEGVTANIWQIRCDTLIVEGTANSQFFDVAAKLEVTGSANVEGVINAEEETVITGRENISGHIDRYCRIMDEDHLHRALELAAASTDPDEAFGIDFVNSNGVTLTQSVTLPENTYWMVDAPLTIGEGVTLTVNSISGQLMGPVEVRGHLVNHAYTQMYCSWGGSISFVNGGTYTSDSELWLYYVEGDPMDYLPGIDMTGYVLFETGDSSAWMIAPEGYNPGGGGGSGDLEFATFEELKELASQTYDSWTWARYSGSETLVIDESIALPYNLPIECSSVEIAAGVTVDAPQLNADKLVVNGTLNVEVLNAYSELTVNGSMLVRNGVYVQEDTVLNGLDKITYTEDWVTISIRYMDNDLQGVKDLIGQAEQETNPRIHYQIYLNQGEAVIEEDLGILANNVALHIRVPLTVQEGVTLTLNNSQVTVNAPVTVYGTLNNNTWINVYHVNKGLMTFGENSTYTGIGTIAVEKLPETALEDAVPGLDLSGLYLRQDGDYWWYISATNGGEGGNDGITFSSFEELKELASQTWDGWTWVEYTGGDVLEITEDIVLPENLNVQTANGVYVAEGVNARFNYLSCGSLEVDGSLHVDYADIGQDGLWVDGSLTVEESLDISYKASMSHIDHIHMVNEWGTINRVYNGVGMNLTWLRELIANLDPYEPARIRHAVHMDTEETVIEEDLIIPNKVNVYFETPLTIAEGATLTVNSDNVGIWTSATVYGTLENNSWLTVSTFGGATLTFAEGSTYTGRGTIAVEKEPSASLESVLPGLDLSELEVRQDGDYWSYISFGAPKFSSFEELKELAKETYNEYTEVRYTGEGTLVISEDITIPENMEIVMENADILIPEGVTANVWMLNVNNLDIRGVLNASAYVMVNGNLTVSGQLKTAAYLGVALNSQVTGQENIKFSDAWSIMTRTAVVSTEEEMAAAAAVAENITWNKEYVDIQIWSEMVLTKDLTIPEKCSVYAYAPITVSEGVTLTVDEYLIAYSDLTVEGTLVNNLSVGVHRSYGWSGSMTVAEGGKYEGRGQINIFGQMEDPAVAVSGLNMEDFAVSNNYDRWTLVYVAGLTPVAAPSELEWGYTYKDGVKVALPGAVSWKSGITDTNGTEYVYFYRINEDGSETLMNEYGGVGYDAKNYMAGYNSSMELVLGNIPSGRYYFTVRSQGDYENTRDSETVRSSVWEYTKPDVQLDTATNLGWSDDSFRAEWTNPNGEDEVHIALVQWYYKNSEDGNEYIFASLIADDDEFAELREYLVAVMGTGYYSYEVQFVSADITRAVSSELSERSEWYHLDKLPETPTAQLGGLLNDPDKTNEEKLEEVQNMGADTLKEIMEENSDAMNILVQMETTVAGGTAQIDVSTEVSEEIAELVMEEISIVGANLNSKVDESAGVTLVIDKVERERDITGNYDTSTAVQFSMTLENVKDTKNLEVPVVVTIPVPAGIAADKVVVLHYHDDGTYDVINPEVYISGGKAYAQFILTGFSDFAILEKLAALLGDVDLNEGVDVDDVLALLWYVLFPDMYPVEVDADYDHNGSVDVDDVLTLLWYVLFPDEYPLS